MPAHVLAPNSRHNKLQSSVVSRAICTILSVTLSFALPLASFAAPTVIVNNPNDNTGNGNTPNQPTDPQVAPQPATPFNENASQPNPNSENSSIPNALENPNSLASNMQPSDADLSAANQELLSRNAQLQRDVNDLETRVNVLINERSGQLFMYGAVTVAVSLFLGFLLGAFVMSRRERW